MTSHYEQTSAQEPEDHQILSHNRRRSRVLTHLWVRDAEFANPPLLRWAYCTQLVFVTFLLIPVWAAEYVFNWKAKPRTTWSLSEALEIPFLRRVSAMTQRAGVQHQTCDPTKPPTRNLKETRFQWMNGLDKELTTGVVDDTQVKPMERVGTYVWEKKKKSKNDTATVLKEDDEWESQATAVPDGKNHFGEWVGIYLHGGGYTHFCAHESAQTSRIPRRLMESGAFSSIYAVEYRLLPHGPFPAALQDAASVYAHLIKSQKVLPERIIIIGDSAGGNIALALARWIRDEATLPIPGGLLLLSPWCDPSHSFAYTESAHIPRPNAESDYLDDQPSARQLLVNTFLGSHHPSFVDNPYISPASPIGTHGYFNGFPPSFIHYGDAERLEAEIDTLVNGFRRDGVVLDLEKTKDAPHDFLMLHFWNEGVRGEVYGKITEWLKKLGNRGEVVAGRKL